MVAAVLHLHEGARAAFDAVDEMRGGLRHRHDVVDDDLFLGRDAEGRARQHVPVRAPEPRALSFSSLPRTSATSGMSAKVAGSVCAAQPVTTMRAAGRSRLSRRIA